MMKVIKGIGLLCFVLIAFGLGYWLNSLMNKPVYNDAFFVKGDTLKIKDNISIVGYQSAYNKPQNDLFISIGKNIKYFINYDENNNIRDISIQVNGVRNGMNFAFDGSGEINGAGIKINNQQIASVCGVNRKRDSLYAYKSYYYPLTGEDLFKDHPDGDIGVGNSRGYLNRIDSHVNLFNNDTLLYPLFSKEKQAALRKIQISPAEVDSIKRVIRQRELEAANAKN